MDLEVQVRFGVVPEDPVAQAPCALDQEVLSVLLPEVRRERVRVLLCELDRELLSELDRERLFVLDLEGRSEAPVDLREGLEVNSEGKVRTTEDNSSSNKLNYNSSNNHSSNNRVGEAMPRSCEMTSGLKTRGLVGRTNRTPPMRTSRTSITMTSTKTAIMTF